MSAYSNSDRVPPYDDEAERALLGACLLNSRDALTALCTLTRPEHFYSPLGRHVAELLAAEHAAGRTADPITIADAARRAGHDVDLCDLITLQALTPGVANVVRYATIIRDHALRRDLLAIADDLANAAYALDDPVESATRTRGRLEALEDQEDAWAAT